MCRNVQTNMVIISLSSNFQDHLFLTKVIVEAVAQKVRQFKKRQKNKNKKHHTDGQ